MHGNGAAQDDARGPAKDRSNFLNALPASASWLPGGGTARYAFRAHSGVLDHHASIWGADAPSWAPGSARGAPTGLGGWLGAQLGASPDGTPRNSAQFCGIRRNSL